MNTQLTIFLARACFASILLATVSAPAVAMIANPHGSKAEASHAMREIKLDDATRSINVSRNEVVRIVNAAGEKFTWQFDTLHHPTIELGKIAPAGFSARPILIYVGQGINERG